jgi:hypothetical protein
LHKHLTGSHVCYCTRKDLRWPWWRSSFHADFPWWLLLALALAPDLFLVGYLAGQRVGAVLYDAAHTSALPVSLAAIGVVTESDWPVQVGLIWLAHIGVDRAIGYGLRYRAGFEDTHLQHV